MSKYAVGVFVGSLRSGAFTRKLAQALGGLAPEQLDLAIVEFGDLPLYAYAAWIATIAKR